MQHQQKIYLTEKIVDEPMANLRQWYGYYFFTKALAYVNSRFLRRENASTSVTVTRALNGRWFS